MRAYFHLPYRQTQGVVIAHASKEVPGIPHYSTISKRTNRLDITINEKLGNDIVIALDSTGIKVANRGEWKDTPCISSHQITRAQSDRGKMAMDATTSNKQFHLSK